MKIIKLTKENWKDAARKYFFTEEDKEIKDYIEQTIEPDYFKSVVTCIPFRIVRNQFAELPF